MLLLQGQNLSDSLYMLLPKSDHGPFAQVHISTAPCSLQNKVQWLPTALEWCLNPSATMFEPYLYFPPLSLMPFDTLGSSQNESFKPCLPTSLLFTLFDDNHHVKFLWPDPSHPLRTFANATSSSKRSQTPQTEKFSPSSDLIALYWCPFLWHQSPHPALQLFTFMYLVPTRL